MVHHRAAKGQYRGVGAALALAALVAVPQGAAAVDLAGHWLFEVDGTADVVAITQAGDTVTIPVTVPSVGSVVFTGPVTAPGEFNLTRVGDSSPSFFGRLLADESAIDGLFFTGAGFKLLVFTRCSCDDGNTDNGDGCDSTCQVEPCFTCTGDPSVCTPTADGGACDDRRDCTTGETCTGGVCAGGSAVVPCVDMTGLWHLTASALGNMVEGAARITQRSGIVRLVFDSTFESISGEHYMGPIDVATGNFDLAGLEFEFAFGCALLNPLTGSAGPNMFTAAGHLQSQNPSTCEQYDVTVTGTRTTCGDGVINTGEQCDDGNIDSRDGCDEFCVVEQCYDCSGEPSTCAVETDGTLCSDGNPCTAGDVCQAGECESTPVVCGLCATCNPAAGGCVGAPKVACRDAGLSILKLRNRTPDSADLLNWKLSRGDATALTDFGDPTVNATYTLCVYDTSTSPPGLLFRAQAPAGSKWRTNGSTGFSYKSADGAPEGLTKLVLKADAAGKSRVLVKGTGPLLSSRPAGLPPLPLPSAVKVQLQLSTTFACFESDYSVLDIIENDPATGRFKARTIGPQ